MMTGKQYVESLRQLKTRIYAYGEKLENFVDHPLVKPHINSAAVTYDMAHGPELEDLLTVPSHLTGSKVNRFTHIHQSTDDLVKKVKMLRALAQRTGSCFQRCVGFDGINALYSTTFDMDREYATEYHHRIREYVRYLQETDKMVAGSMTDPKGDRGKAPHEQHDPDLYVHVVEKNEQGIVIRGAKAHQTGIINSHEMLIMPTVALNEEAKDYAVACAIPVDAPNVVHIFGRQTNDSRKYDEMDQGNAMYGVVGGEALSVLDNVFVPWNRVFMCGEYEFTNVLVQRFACYHRQNYGGCKAGVSDVVIGATAALAEMNGVDKASHIKDKLVEMIHLTETLYCGSIACSYQGHPTPSGAYFVDPLLANVTKLNATRFIYEICRLGHDVAGGLIATLPSERDLRHLEVGKYVEKYFKGVASIPTVERMRIVRLLENMTGCTALAESMHGAGSPQAQRVMILRQGNLRHKINLAKRLASLQKN